jgi:hypothetical protein
MAAGLVSVALGFFLATGALAQQQGSNPAEATSFKIEDGETKTCTTIDSAPGGEQAVDRLRRQYPPPRYDIEAGRCEDED